MKPYPSLSPSPVRRIYCSQLQTLCSSHLLKHGANIHSLSCCWPYCARRRVSNRKEEVEICTRIHGNASRVLGPTKFTANECKSNCLESQRDDLHRLPPKNCCWPWSTTKQRLKAKRPWPQPALARQPLVCFNGTDLRAR